MNKLLKTIVEKHAEVIKARRELQEMKQELALKQCPYKVDKLTDINGSKFIPRRIAVPFRWSEKNTWCVVGDLISDDDNVSQFKFDENEVME